MIATCTTARAIPPADIEAFSIDEMPYITMISKGWTPSVGLHGCFDKIETDIIQAVV